MIARVLVSLLATALGAACSASPPDVGPVAAPVPASPAPDSGADAARLVLEEHCGVCHRDDSFEAKPEALAVFDLNEPVWHARMSDAQLHDAVRRVRDLVDMTPSSAPEDLAPFGGPTRPEELRVLEAFVNAELARRGAAHVASPVWSGSARRE